MIGPMLFSPMKATLKFLIERIKSTFVTSEMIELDLNDDKSELTKVVTLGFGHISHLVLYNHWSSFMDVLTQSNSLIF